MRVIFSHHAYCPSLYLRLFRYFSPPFPILYPLFSLPTFLYFQHDLSYTVTCKPITGTYGLFGLEFLQCIICAAIFFWGLVWAGFEQHMVFMPSRYIESYPSSFLLSLLFFLLSSLSTGPLLGPCSKKFGKRIH